MDTKVNLFERGSWEHVSTLSDDLITQVSFQRAFIIAIFSKVALVEIKRFLGETTCCACSMNRVCVFKHKCPLQPVNVVAWSPCGQFLAAGCVGGSLTVWDVNSKLCVERYCEMFTKLR